MSKIPKGTIYKSSDGKIIITKEYWDYDGSWVWRLWGLSPGLVVLGITIFKPFWRQKDGGRATELSVRDSWVKHYNLEPTNEQNT